MNDLLAGRFFVQPGTGILIGTGVSDALKQGCVYQIQDDLFGGLIIKKIGVSKITDTELATTSIDQLIARAQGQHCLVEGE